jgi:hypothetical protein
MTDSAKQAWSDVGDKFASWGRRVTDRYHEAKPSQSESAEERQRELKRSMKELVDELSRGFSAVGDTLRDNQAKQELNDAVGALGDAITATVDEATQAIRSGGGSDDKGSNGSGSAGGGDAAH